LKFRGTARLKQVASALNTARDGLGARKSKSHETSCCRWQKGRVTKPLRGFSLKFRGTARMKQTVSALNTARDGLGARRLKSHETSCCRWQKGRVTKPLRGFVLKFRGTARLKQVASTLNAARDKTASRFCLEVSWHGAIETGGVRFECGA
jgi:uncharacterized protein YdbL (DUF1318 family)